MEIENLCFISLIWKFWSMYLNLFLSLFISLIFVNTKGEMYILRGGHGIPFIFVMRGLTTLICYLFLCFVHLSKKSVVILKTRENVDLCAFRYMGCNTQMIIVFWRRQYYDVKYLSEVMIKIIEMLCLWDQNVKTKLLKITPNGKRRFEELLTISANKSLIMVSIKKLGHVSSVRRNQDPYEVLNLWWI